MKFPAILGALALATACSAPTDSQTGDDSVTDDTPADNGGSDHSDSFETGQNFRVLLTDAPGDFDEVWVDIASVEVQSDAGWLTLADTPQSFDLLTLQNDVTAALGGADLLPGHYGQLRLVVADAFVVVEGVAEELRIASGPQTGIKINLDTDVEENMQYTVVVDFDAHKSVKKTGQGWLMTPVIKVKDVTGTPVAEEPADDSDDDDGEGDDSEGTESEDGETEEDGAVE